MTVARQLNIFPLAIAGVAAIVVPSAHAETFKSTLSPAKPAFAWNGYGAGGPGFECSNEAEFQCDSVVFTLETTGDLTLSIDTEGEQITNPSGAMPYPNLDLYLFNSDAAGVKSGEPIAEAATASDDEKLTATRLSAGRYVLEVRSSFSVGENYAGKAKLSNFPLATAPPSVAAPSPAAAPPAPAPGAASKPKAKRSAKATCRAKAKKVKNSKKRARALKRCAKLKR